jgi:hypothetical protein
MIVSVSKKTSALRRDLVEDSAAVCVVAGLRTRIMLGALIAGVSF